MNGTHSDFHRILRDDGGGDGGGDSYIPPDSGGIDNSFLPPPETNGGVIDVGMQGGSTDTNNGFIPIGTTDTPSDPSSYNSSSSGTDQSSVNGENTFLPPDGSNDTNGLNDSFGSSSADSTIKEISRGDPVTSDTTWKDNVTAGSVTGILSGVFSSLNGLFGKKSSGGSGNVGSNGFHLPTTSPSNSSGGGSGGLSGDLNKILSGITGKAGPAKSPSKKSGSSNMLLLVGVAVVIFMVVRK